MGAFLRGWGAALAGALLVVGVVAGLTPAAPPALGAPGPQATGTRLIQDAGGPNLLVEAAMVGVVATPGAAGTPGVYGLVAVDNTGQLAVNAAVNVSVPTAVPQFTQQPYPTPQATWTPFPTPAPQFTPAALVAGENHVGAVGGNTLHPSSNPALSVAASYATGDYVGTSATPWSWTGCRVSAGTGQLQSVTVIDKALQSIAGELWLFDRSVTVPNDSAAWTITDADAQFLIGVVPFSTYYASAANSVSSNTGLSMPIWCNSGTSIFGAVVTRGAPSYTSGDLTVVLGILAD